MDRKTGFISIIGRPSVGKSTLINTICGYKISITSKYPQTTQFTIRGIYTDNDSQIIFIDTPGFNNSNKKLNRELSKIAIKTLNDGDLILYVVDIIREFGEEEKIIISHLQKYQDKLIIVFNKSDVAKKKLTTEQILSKKGEILSDLTPMFYFEISALKKDNIDMLLLSIKKHLPFGPLYYPEEYVTDQDIKFRITELVREKIFRYCSEELPHSVYVKVDSLKIKEDKIIANSSIYVNKDSQKGIIIGESGKMIKKIGENARKDLKDIFEKDVMLFLNVKVDKNWIKKENFIKDMFRLED